MVHGIEDPHPDQLTGAIGTAFLLLINILMIQKGGLGPRDEYPYDVASHMEDNLDIQFDFIIVGAGAAGCVLANRLTEYRDWKVLLVEAGTDPTSTTEVPAFYPSLLKTNEDWSFVTVKNDRACQGMIDKVCRIPKGKVLGGSSSINNLQYARANARDFDNWADMGNNDWGPDSVNFFYERLENYKGPNFYPIHYGTAGELILDSFNNEHYVKDMIYEAASRMKYDKLKEQQYLGYIDNVVTIRSGARFNMAKAFLTPIKTRKNLFVVKKGFITKVLIPDMREKRIKGVECLLEDKVINIRVKREVILSAGALNTAKIMLLSGLGPANHLKELEMPIVANMKVGENLQEHIGVPIFVGLDKNNTEPIDQLYELIDATYLYMMHRRGPLASTNINDLVGFLNTRIDPYEYPNVIVYHYHFSPDDINFKGFLDGIGYEPEIVKSLLKHNQNQTIVLFLPTVLKPKSRGTVHLNGTSPLEQLKINANFLSDEGDEDLMTLFSGFKYVMRMVETAPFVQHNAEVLHIDIPNCRNFKFCTDFFIKCHIRNLAYPQGDVVGTTKMGPACDSDVVVDEDLLVTKGVRGLRIVDASIMPEIVSGNIQATAAMIADKISECIKVKWIKNYEPQPSCKCLRKYD